MNQKPAEPGIREVVRQLADALGPAMVAAMAGDRVRPSVNDWVLEDGPVPDEDEETRLRFAYEQWNLLAWAEGPDYARAWFIDTNPKLGDDSPDAAIREGRFREVYIAARAVVDDAWAD
jgi:hypothetical protein